MKNQIMLKTISLVVLIISSIFSASAQNPPRVKLDFENCDINRKEKTLTCNEGKVDLDGVANYTPVPTNAIKRSGKTAMRFELHNDEYLGRSNSYRTEIELHRFHQNDIRDRNDFYLGFWIYVPKEFPDQKGWQVIAQYKQPGGSNGLSLSPPVGLVITPGSNPRFEVEVIGDSRSKGVTNTNQQEKEKRDLGAVEKGKWTHFVVHTKFNPKLESSNNKKGRVRVWRDGKLKADRYGRLGYEFDVGIQTRIGMYRSRVNHSTAWLAYDDIILDYSYEAVGGKSNNTPAPADNKRPKVAFKNIKNGDKLAAGANLNPVVNASDDDGSITYVKLYLNNKLVRQENAAPYAWGKLDDVLKNLKSGNYKLKAVAKDNKGATGQTEISITVGNVSSPPPTNNNGQLIANGLYSIKSSSNDQRILSDGNRGYNAEMTNNGNFTDRQWEFIHLGQNNYSIKNVRSNRFLEVPFGKCENGANVTSHLDGSQNHQKWSVAKNGPFYSIRPLHCLEKALDRDGGKEFANIHLWAFSANNGNQKWEIIKTNRGAKSLTDNTNFISISPNPISANSILTINGIEIGKQITIYNTIGQIVKQVISNSPQQQINTENLRTGIYFVNYNNEAALKFIIN